MQGRAGHVQGQNPLRHGARNGDPVRTGLRGAHQEIKRDLLTDGAVGHELQPLLKEEVRGRQLRDEVLHHTDVAVEQTEDPGSFERQLGVAIFYAMNRPLEIDLATGKTRFTVSTDGVITNLLWK